LGANGAEEIKRHPFFNGIDWKAYAGTSVNHHNLEYVPERDTMSMGPSRRQKAQKDLPTISEDPGVSKTMQQRKKLRGWSFVRT